MAYFEFYLMGIILVPGLILAIIAQYKVMSAYNTYSKIKPISGKTGAQVAREILDVAGLQKVKINTAKGELSDNFNPKNNTVNLSSNVANTSSIASIGIAAHEVGHAIQFNTNYLPIKIRTAVVKVSNFASMLLWPLVVVGLLLNFLYIGGVAGQVLVWAGIAFFGVALIANLVTLPVEYNASNRAIAILSKGQFLSETEMVGCKKVLRSAGLTYIAAFIMSVLNLVRFLLIVGVNRD